MSVAKKSTEVKVFSPFSTRIDAPKKSDFEKFYYDYEYKQVYRKAGVDDDGEEYGRIETKVITKKRDIAEFIAQDANNVGVEAYMRALSVQGASLGDFNTAVSNDIQDFTDIPKDKLEAALVGDKALDIFNSLDPALRGNHTTIEGFLKSLSKDSIDSYIKGKVDALFPHKEVKNESEGE